MQWRLPEDAQLWQPRTQGLSINNPGTGRKVLNSDWPIKNT